MQPVTPSIQFSWGWRGFALGEARPCSSTYCEFPYEQLPPIPTLDGTLSWLGTPGSWGSLDVSADQQATRDRLCAEARENVHTLVMQAKQLDLVLPNAFTRLMAAPDLYARIPDYGGCWFNLYQAQIDPCPGSEDGFVVRFLNDQQDCILWYLYVTRSGEEAVLSVGDPFPDAPSPYLEDLIRPDEDGPWTDEQRRAILASTMACAPSFEAFVFRWWREATIYMKLNGFNPDPLTQEERLYFAHYQHKQSKK